MDKYNAKIKLQKLKYQHQKIKMKENDEDFSPSMEGQEIRQEIPRKKNIFAILRTSVEQEEDAVL